MQPVLRICALAITTAALLVFICGVAIAPGRSSPADAQSPCALANWPAWPNESPCSPYTRITVPRMATFSRDAFYSSCQLGALAALSDGSAVVEESPYALFRIRGARVGVLWASRESRYCVENTISDRINGQPRPPPLPVPCYEFLLLGSFESTAVIQCGDGGGDWIFGITAGGFVGLRFFTGGDLAQGSIFYGRDPDGALWFYSPNARFPQGAIYACEVAASKCVPLTEPVQNVFQGPFGFIYANVDKNVVYLRSTPDVRAHFFRGPIPLSTAQLPGMTDIAVSRIGRDGSAWATTPINVIHQHPNGQVKIIKLQPEARTSHSGPLGLNIAPDGSAWVASGSGDKLVRITKDDRVEVMVIPGLAPYPEIHFSRDGTVWLKTPNAITHVAPPSI